MSSQIAKKVCLEEIDKDAVRDQFGVLEKHISHSEDRLQEARLFIESFINELNAKYNIEMDLLSIAQYLIGNLDKLHVPDEFRPQFLLIIDALVGQPAIQEVKLYWPWDWNWFGLNKGKKEETPQVHELSLASVVPNSMPPRMDAGVIVGVLEIIAGTSIAYAFGETGIGAIIGGSMVYDGMNRISNRGQNDLEAALRDHMMQQGGQ